MKSKYIVFESPHDLEVIVAFEGFITHSDMQIRWYKPISAGFIDVKTGECWGRSESLKLKSRPDEDTKLAQRLLKPL